MDAEITSLEERLSRLLAEYSGLHMENRELTTRVATLQAENKRLVSTLSEVTTRVESLLKRLPAEEAK
jgi:regulator of replication initiation timing